MILFGEVSSSMARHHEMESSEFYQKSQACSPSSYSHIASKSISSSE
jgi:hypothetical protein